MRHAACLPARMGGGGKTGIDALVRASGPRPPHGGVYFRFREREGKALGVPAYTQTEAISRASPQRGERRHPRNGVTQTGGVAASEAGARPLFQRGSAASPQRKRARRPTGKERGESTTRVSQEHRALRNARRGKERDLYPSRSISHALIRCRNRHEFRLVWKTAFIAGFWCRPYLAQETTLPRM